jgi:hypothetical protein
MALTEKQQRAYDLKKEGKTYNEIASIEGVSHSVICKRLRVAYKKLGLPSRDVGQKALPPTSGVEYRDPEAAAAMIDAASDPLAKVKDALAACGLPERVSDAMLKRLRVKFFGAVHEVRALKTQEITRMLEEKIDMVRYYLDDKVMAEASARDLMLGLGVMIEKRALLRGEPTQIVSDHERKKLNELVPLLIAEAQRRGRTIDVTPEHAALANPA